MNTDCDYSSAYVILTTSSPDLKGVGMTFTIGRGTDIVCLLVFCLIAANNPQVCSAIKAVADRVIGKDVEEIFADMGKAWNHLTADSQLRWIGPEKGVIHIATGAVGNALWDMYARSRNKPLWKLIVDFTPVRLEWVVAILLVADVVHRRSLSDRWHSVIFRTLSPLKKLSRC